jgi:homoserine kinase
MTPQPIRLKLPATSANLGPGFDAVGLALSMHLSVEAHAAPVTTVIATGRSADLVGQTEDNLLLETYFDILSKSKRKPQNLKLHIHNEIPLGAGAGSSAAALLAGVALADHFGGLHLGDEGIVAEACRREGHPDNVAACWYGGFTTSVQSAPDSGHPDGPPTIQAATFVGDPAWEIVLAVQPSALATKTARALLPETYARADAVFNIQRTSLLTAAFALNRLDLLRTATEDALHQPYRRQACPLLAQLLPLAAEPEIAAVTLSGAGPSVLIFLAAETTFLEAEMRLRQIVAPDVELLSLRIAGGATRTIL